MNSDKKKDEPEAQFMPRKNCRRCYGRGYIGQNLTTRRPEFCSCLKKRPIPEKKGGVFDAKKQAAKQQSDVSGNA